MERLLKIYNKDKEYVKMINQSHTGFELIINSESVFKEIIEKLYLWEKEEDTINIVWQMKFKKANFIVYKKCKFSDPMDNKSYQGVIDLFPLTNIAKTNFSKKIKVSCESTSFYTESPYFKNKKVKKSYGLLTFKDGKFLDRIIKIDNLNQKSENI